MSVPKTSRIWIRVTEAQEAQLKLQADWKGLSPNQYAREVIAKHLLGHEEYKMQMLLHRQMVISSQLSQLFVDRFGEDQWLRTNKAAAKRSAETYGPMVPLPGGLEVNDQDIDNVYALHSLLRAF